MVNQVSGTAGLAYQPDYSKKAASKAEGKKNGGEAAAFTLDISLTSEAKSSRALSKQEIENIKNQTDATTSALKDVVEKLIVKQKSHNTTITINMEILTAGADGAAALPEDADWGVEAVSDRIVDFARSISGGDPAKIEMLREAIDKGFAGAKKTLGGKLPEVSMDNYDAVMQKLDDWAGETAPAATVE